MTKLTRIELIFYREDGSGHETTIKADISADYGWSQWGAETALLGDNVDALTDITTAALEHLS